MRRIICHLLTLALSEWIAFGAAGGVVRFAPAQALPGVAFPVTNAVTFTSAVSVQAVEDEIPAGWSAASISHSGRFDAVSHKVKWGPFFDNTPRNLSCVITAPVSAAGDYPFVGKASFDGTEVAIGGASSIRVLTPAQANRADATLPLFYSPGVGVDLKIVVKPAANVFGYAVEDSLPAGWTASGFTDGGAAAGGKLKWGPFFDANTRELHCTLTPPAGATDAVIFSGVASFDGAEVPIGGGRQIGPLLSRIDRTLPDFFGADPFTVHLTTHPAPGVQVYSVSETLPTGWTADTISDGGVFDTARNAVKWGPYFDGIARSLSFNVQPPPNANAPASFAGEGAFDNNRILTTGPTQVFPITGSAVRYLPASAGFLETISITNRVSPKPGALTWAVQDAIPTGWSVVNISEDGVFDANTRKVKWGPFFDDLPRALVCVVISSASAGTAHFAGTVSFDAIDSTISGASDVQVVAPAAGVSVITRDLPDSARPGTQIALQAHVIPAPSISVYAIEERIPAGWTASNITDGGAFDAQNHSVKWGPFFDSSVRNLSCNLLVPLDAIGAASFSGHGSFDGVDLDATGDESLNVVGVPNRTPVAADDAFTRPTDRPLTITLAKILANDSDPDGDALTVTIPATTAKGYPIAILSGAILYSPAPPFNEADSFVYTVHDPYGATATATATIQPPPPGATQNVAGLTPGSGSVVVQFSGIPNFSYDIEVATTLSPADWTTVARRVADANGKFEFTDSGASTPQRYYRTIFVE